jgi:uncharacterized protein (TIGR03067 family)
MKRLPLQAVISAALLAAVGLAGQRGNAADKDNANDAKQLQGKWTMWRMENSNGITADCHDSMVFDGAEIQNLNGGTTQGTRFKFTIDPTKDPKEIDVEILARGNIGEKRLGIYRMSNDVLEICWGDSKKRPTTFTGKPGAGAGSDYLIYHGEKFKQDEATATEMKRMEGRWAAEKGGDGMVIDGDELQFLWGGNNKGAKAKFLVDPSKDPSEIEVIYTQGSEIYKKRIGIYKLDGDKLTVSLSDLDADKRPTKLAGGDAPGAGKWFGVFRRQTDR